MLDDFYGDQALINQSASQSAYFTLNVLNSVMGGLDHSRLASAQPISPARFSFSPPQKDHGLLYIER
jgi:hypothetical protein